MKTISQAEKIIGILSPVLTTPKTSSEKLALAVVEMQQIPNIEKIDCRKGYCLKWTKCNGRRKVRLKLKTDTDNIKILVYRCRNNLYLKDNESDLNLTEKQSLVAEKFYVLSYIDIVFKQCIQLD